MNRPIKFRAWVLETEGTQAHMDYQPNPTMFTATSTKVHPFDLLEILHRLNINEILRTENMAWMQFTGLYDKNGKEIWEGDVVKVGDFNRYQVKWLDSHGLWMPNLDSAASIEILGNIYENPDLLTSRS